MDIKRIRCDVKECMKEDATRFTAFKDRKADAAGGMENWHFVFDLCPHHTIIVLRDLLDSFRPDDTRKLLAKHRIDASDQ